MGETHAVGQVLGHTEMVDNSLWLSKEESAAFLGVKVRQIERREAAGNIRKRTLPRESGQTTARVVYSRSDLMALKAGTPNDYRPAGALTTTPGAGKGAGSVAVPSVDATAGWAQAFGTIFERLNASAADPKPWLTLKEAAEFSGLPASWLKKQAEQAYVHALDIGRHARGGRWRFRREGLASIGA